MATTIGGIATSATTPLSGTELMEAEQSGTTVKVAVEEVAKLATIAIKQDGVAKGAAKTMNFTGNVTVTDDGSGQLTILITAPDPGIAGISVSDEGVEIDPEVVAVNYTGSGVTVTQVSAGVVQVAITGGGGGGAVAVEDEGVSVDGAAVTLNFTGNVEVTQTIPGEVQINVPAPAAPTLHYDFGFFVGGLPPANSVVFRHKFARAVNFPADFSTSAAEATDNSTGTAAWTIRKVSGGVTTTVGTVTWSAGNPIPVFASTGGAAVSFADDDTMEILTPVTQDATLAGCTITVAGTRAA